MMWNPPSRSAHGSALGAGNGTCVLVLVMLGAVALAGCGQKGPLWVPGYPKTAIWPMAKPAPAATGTQGNPSPGATGTAVNPPSPVVTPAVNPAGPVTATPDASASGPDTAAPAAKGTAPGGSTAAQ